MSITLLEEEVTAPPVVQVVHLPLFEEDPIRFRPTVRETNRMDVAHRWATDRLIRCHRELDGELLQLMLNEYSDEPSFLVPIATIKASGQPVRYVPAPPPYVKPDTSWKAILPVFISTRLEQFSVWFCVNFHHRDIVYTPGDKSYQCVCGRTYEVPWK